MKKSNLIVLKPSEEIPDSLIKEDYSFKFVLQGNNLFTLKNTPMHTILNSIEQDKAKEILEKEYGEGLYNPAELHLLRNSWDKFQINKEDFAYVMKYFQYIYDTHHSECAVLLMANLSTGRIVPLFVPQVDCSGASVTYLMPADSPDNIQSNKEYYEKIFDDKNLKKLMIQSYKKYNQLFDEDYVLYGTIHSHCNFNAFHSGVDDRDEEEFDGLHITIGNVRSGWSYATRYMLEKVEWKLDNIEMVVKDCKDIKEIEELVDSIELNQVDIDMFMHSLKEERKYTIVTSSSSSSNRKWWTNKDDSQYGWLNFGKINDDAKSETSDDCSFKEKEYIRIFDVIEGEVVWVKLRFYRENIDQFPKNKYVVLQDPDIPSELMKAHEESLFSKDEEEVAELDEDDVVECLYVLDSPKINPNYPSKHKLDAGMIIEDCDSFIKNNRKATKC